MYVCGIAVKISSLTRRQALYVSDERIKRTPQNAMTKSMFRVWPKAVVPYVIDHSLSKLRKIMELVEADNCCSISVDILIHAIIQYAMCLGQRART